MLHFVYASDLGAFPDIKETMFQDRAYQFGTRLKWEVSVNDLGYEQDRYDGLNPLYVIWAQNGVHGGSLRLLPTTGPTMVNEHFAHLLPGGNIRSALVWECTRFCLNRKGGAESAAAVLLGAAEVMRQFSVRYFVGVFDERMHKIYKRTGVSPHTLGSDSRDTAGTWSFDERNFAKLGQRANVSDAQLRCWFDQSINQMGQFNARL